MAHVAALGFPVPAVHAASGPDLVMERLYGPDLLRATTSEGYGAVECGRLLADLHARLHALAPRPGAAEPVLHLDLHPANVVLTARGPVVIDWTNAADGPPDLDVALTAVILAQVAVDPASAYADVAAAVLPPFLEAAPGTPLLMVERAVARRRADRGTTPAELDRLGAAAEFVLACAP